jgi:hypothetical protein
MSDYYQVNVRLKRFDTVGRGLGAFGLADLPEIENEIDVFIASDVHHGRLGQLLKLLPQPPMLGAQLLEGLLGLVGSDRTASLLIHQDAGRHCQGYRHRSGQSEAKGPPRGALMRIQSFKNASGEARTGVLAGQLAQEVP